MLEFSRLMKTLCQEDSWLLVLLCDCFHKSSHYQGSRMITLPNPVRSEIGQSIKQLFAMLEEQKTLALIQCLASPAN